MSSTVKAAMLYGAEDLRLEERQALSIQPDEARVQVKATGLCGSDLHYFCHGRNGNIVMQSPMALGHEVGLDALSASICAVPNEESRFCRPLVSLYVSMLPERRPSC